MAQQNHKYLFDASGEMKDAGLVAASAAAQVDAANKILDLGAGSYVEGTVVIDATAVEVDSSNEMYTIGWQLSNSATFASGIVERAAIALGHSTPLPGDTSLGVGRYTLKVDNECGGTLYRYARLYTTVAGTIGTGINYTAYFSRP